jgi:hypothetical protein
MKYSLISAVAAIALGASALTAQACNPLLNKKGAVATRLPASMLARNNPVSRVGGDSIVGLWHVIHTASDGSLFNETYDMWHSDGTDEELANLPPAGGPICIGIWIQPNKTVKLLTHVTWLYDLNNNFVGTLNMTQANKVKDSGNEYVGTFDAKFYDPSGNLFQEVTGTTAADRLNGG